MKCPSVQHNQEEYQYRSPSSVLAAACDLQRCAEHSHQLSADSQPSWSASSPAHYCLTRVNNKEVGVFVFHLIHVSPYLPWLLGDTCWARPAPSDQQTSWRPLLLCAPQSPALWGLTPTMFGEKCSLSSFPLLEKSSQTPFFSYPNSLFASDQPVAFSPKRFVY